MNIIEKGTILFSLLNGNNSCIDNLNKNEIQDLFNFASINKILPNILNCSYKTNRNYIKNVFCNSKAVYNTTNGKEIIEHLETLKSIHHILTQFECVLIKGIPLSVELYGSSTFRKAGDIDILVDPNIIPEIITILIGDYGFSLLGSDCIENPLRYSANFHEVQLSSFNDTTVEIKKASGEVVLFEENQMINDFLSHRTSIKICDNNFFTLDLLYTFLHLFLSASSNSTTWFCMNDNGLRDFYEISCYIKKFQINLDLFRDIAEHYGLSPLICNAMLKINSMFSQIFTETDINKFSNYGYINPKVIMYKLFHENYKLPIEEEFFDTDKKTHAYYKSINEMYYHNEGSFFVGQETLDTNIIDYSIQCIDNILHISYIIDAPQEKKRKISLRILNSSKDIQSKYGYFTILESIIDKYQTKSVKRFETDWANPSFEESINTNVENRGNKISICINTCLDFLDINIRKICFNIEYSEYRKSGEYYNLTEIYPLRNCICLLKKQDI